MVKLIFSTEGSGTLTTAVTIDSNQNTTFAGPVWIPTYIYHVGDANTFFGFSGNDTFVVNTSGTTALTIDSAGNVGMFGQISPSSYSGFGVLHLGTRFNKIN